MAKRTSRRALIGGKTEIRILIGGRWLRLGAADAVARVKVAEETADALQARRERLRAILG
jgi:hypothetical protein